MKSRFFILYLTLFSYFSAEAQSTIDFKMSYWIDSSRQATFVQARSQKYKPTQPSENLKFVKYPVWVKLHFGNELADIIEVRAKIDTLLYWREGRQGIWERVLTGDRLPFGTRPLAHYGLLFPLDLSAEKSKEVYFCFKTHTQVRLRIIPQTAYDFQRKNADNTLFYGFLYGVMSLMFIYNLAIWWTTRDAAYLYYLGFSFFMLLVQSSQHVYQYVLGNFPFWNNSGVYYWVGAANFCSANFGRLFLDTKQYAPRLGNVLWYVSFYGFAVMLCTTFFSFSFTSRFIFTFNPAYSLFLGISGIIVWIKGNRFAKYYVLAWFAYFAGVFVLALHNRSVLVDSFWVNYALEMSTLAEVVILSLAMSYKYKIMNEEAQENKLKIQALAYQQQLKEAQNKLLQDTLSTKEREVAMLAMQMLEKNNLISQSQIQIQKITKDETDASHELKNISKALQEGLNLDEDWENFRLHFEQVHPAFFQRLTTEYPHLTAHDQKALAYLRINLGTKDIARLMNIDAKSVKMLKYRIKKKLNLPEAEDLEGFVRNF